MFAAFSILIHYSHGFITSYSTDISMLVREDKHSHGLQHWNTNSWTVNTIIVYQEILALHHLLHLNFNANSWGQCEHDQWKLLWNVDCYVHLFFACVVWMSSAKYAQNLAQMVSEISKFLIYYAVSGPHYACIMLLGEQHSLQ